ncbi:MAG: DUF4446 family protein [Lachnospiraceae bacterium]|nr:DUF4446 family protein [Lachnospiraceae bacterium]
MNNAFLTSIGLGNLDLGIVILVLIVIIIVLLALIINNSMKISRFTKKYASFMKGRAAKSLEEEIAMMFEENRAMKAEITQNKRDIKSIYKQLTKTFQKLGFVKYDAFDQMGGKLSFCIVLLDEEDNGFLLNSVHSNGNDYSYVKRITEGTCKQELSSEELNALNKALHGESNETH